MTPAEIAAFLRQLASMVETEQAIVFRLTSNSMPWEVSVDLSLQFRLPQLPETHQSSLPAESTGRTA